MNSSVPKTNQPLKSGQGLPPPNTQNILLDKLNARRATPDSISEAAVASSDDEAAQDLSQSIQSQKPPRRSSWLVEPTLIGHRQSQRKDSFASSSMSPTTSHPSTPSAETNAVTWGSAANSIMTRPHAGSASFGWGQASGIWNNRQDPPSRLSEVLSSPTSNSASDNSFLNQEGNALQTSPAHNSSSNSQIPFAIPIHPTPKNYRSQSYSVGQLDPDTSVPTPTTGPSAMMGARSRALPHPGLQHRPSRPSMLSEMSNEGGMLGKLKEVDDDDLAYAEAGAQAQLQSAEAHKTIEMLSRENAMLRQQHLNASRMRPRASTGYGGGLGNGYGIRDPLPEESSESAVDDELNDPDAAGRRGFSRRMSEYGNAPFRSSFTLETRPNVENRPLENVKKAIWSTSQGFSLADQPQSRRHSFADVPTRQPSAGPVGEQPLSQEPGYMDGQQGQNLTVSQIENAMLAQMNLNSGNFYNGSGITGAQPSMMPSGYGAMYQSAYGMQAPFSANRPPSPHRGGLYGMPQPRHAQKLHVVLFKCNRADVFYIQEGTGLTVKAGDLVIVEADRGTDLGTVSRENVDWNAAKEWKEHYAEEHYKWLMMFSQNAAAAQDGTGAGLMAASNGMHGGAVGGMGPPSHNHMQEPNSGDLKPKLIKRHAQPHEVQALREKEGNEAKAKRVCQSKVKDHGLNMEILDAEFQMDWKKLTFYYFADSYINFNSLVTDLFKIYKTRIWMSAINPASFASPSIGQTPSGVGPGAVGVGRTAPNDRRQNPQQQQLEPQSSFGPSSAVATRPFPGGIAATPFGNDRGTTPLSQLSQPPAYSYSYGGGGGFSNNINSHAAPRPMASAFIPNADPYATAFTSGDYTQQQQQQQQRSRAGFPPPQSTAPPQHEQPISPLTAQNDWASSFQGLSLNGGR